MKQRLMCLLSLALLVGFVVSIQPARAADARCEPEKVATKYPGLAGKTLKVGVTGDSPPFSYRDPNNFERMTGFVADFARATFACIGVNFDFAPSPFSGLVLSVTAGQIDLAWSSLFYNPERAKAVDFVMYMTGGSGGVVMNANVKKIHSLDDLCGVRGASVVGTYELVKLKEVSAACVAAGKPEIEIITTPGRTESLLLLTNDRADVYLGVGAKLAYDPKIFTLAFVYSNDLRVGVGVKKGNAELERAIYDSFIVLQANGVEAKLYDTYGLDHELSRKPEIVLE